MDLAGGDGIIREPNYFDKEFTMQLQALMVTGEYSVFPIKRIATGGKGAVKIVDLRARDDVGGKREQRDPCREELAKTEAGLWRELCGHPNVIGLQSAILQDQCCLFVMDSFQSTLRHKVHHGNLARKDSQLILRQALLGVKACHDARIVHRRISLESFLVAQDGTTVKLCDLGSAARLPVGRGKLKGAMGEMSAMSPEMLRGGEYGTDTDMWSYGVVAHTVLFRKHPFLHGDQVDRDALKKAVCAGEVRPICEDGFVEDSEEDAYALLSRLLSVDPAQRPSADEALEHALLRRGSAPTLSKAQRPPGQWALLMLVIMCLIRVVEAWAL
jgi:serine/threonine protein kinase